MPFKEANQISTHSRKYQLYGINLIEGPYKTTQNAAAAAPTPAPGRRHRCAVVDDAGAQG